MEIMFPVFFLLKLVPNYDLKDLFAEWPITLKAKCPIRRSAFSTKCPDNSKYIYFLNEFPFAGQYCVNQQLCLEYLSSYKATVMVAYNTKPI